MKNTLYQSHIISVDSFSAKNVDSVFRKADEMKVLVQKSGGDDRLKGKIMAALFYEPSSRTFSSFVTAMQRLGGGVIPLNSMTHTSVHKGESLEDTARVFSSYADVLVIRHNQKGVVATFAVAATVPTVNAGDGSGEHPTQALLDAYTVKKSFQSFPDVTVGLIGDLLYGRTVHSLAKLFATLGVKRFVFISPEHLKMPDEITSSLVKNGCSIRESDELTKGIAELDVIYNTRVQKERFEDLKLYERLKLRFVIDPSVMKNAKKSAVLMHPLPRVGEIHPDTDRDPRALYFREQMRNGMYVRMAILDMVLRHDLT